MDAELQDLTPFSPELQDLTPFSHCPDCAIATPRLGRAGRPHRPRARQKAKSEEHGHQPRRRRVNDIDLKKTDEEEQARSDRQKKSRFVPAGTDGPASMHGIGHCANSLAPPASRGHRIDSRRAFWATQYNRRNKWRLVET